MQKAKGSFGVSSGDDRLSAPRKSALSILLPG
jgi:hypothetical protein